ncbi:hypothetical protein RU639_013556 [Aspergillus parasiticus]
MESFKFPPPPIPGAKTYVYKAIGDLKLEVDVFIPANLPYKDTTTAVLFLHGGGWIGGDRTEYCRPLFNEFLARQYVVASANYRLLPESDFVAGQLEDIRDLSKWMHEDLSHHLSQNGLRISIGDVIVAGASAGALLALLTPKLWSQKPAAILSIYGPTDLRRIQPVKGGPLTSVDMPELTSERISSVFDMESPIASTPPPKSFEDFVFNPRQQMAALEDGNFRKRDKRKNPRLMASVPCILQSRLLTLQRTRHLAVKTSFLRSHMQLVLANV